ncbi:hypothetical protein QF021_001946 [Acidovorax delafieldii]|uniref:hypothetical protein n=1 Tax=Acidovorax delafieldii TaxID=47920 RepID=UPI0028616D19|nr:hypothetical protein [Acidovorax delafieldii]MDR6153857.1 hypothetical protein [Acidovorax delafieldii]
MGGESDALTTAEYDGRIRRLVRSCLRPDGGPTESGGQRFNGDGIASDAKMGGWGMRDEVAKGIPVEIDWDASAWSLTEVFNAFLLRDFELTGKSRDIINSLNSDDYSKGKKPLIIGAHKKLRKLIKRFNITVQMETELHPAVWLRLLHFISESTGLRFRTMEVSYRDWRKSNDNATLVIRRQIPETIKWRSYAVDVFLLQKIDWLNLETSYEWGESVIASPTSENSDEVSQSEQSKIRNKNILKKRIEKIGKEVCRNVKDMLVNSKKQRIPYLSSMRANALAKSASGETRRYQYQGSASELAQYLKNQINSPVSRRSDMAVTKAVRLYVKCS